MDSASDTEMAHTGGFRTMAVMLDGGIGAILLGLPYIFHAFGPTEAEVVTWGEVSLCTGVVLVFLSAGIGRSNNRAAKLVLALGYIILALLQVPPIFLGFRFSFINTWNELLPRTFVARWSA